MRKIIKDLWILLETGAILFNHTYEKRKIDPNLFGAMMSALNSYAEAISEGGLCSFEIGRNRITIILVNEILFICSSSLKVKTEIVIFNLNKIATEFFKNYPDFNKNNWNNDAKVFTSFATKIEKYVVIGKKKHY